MSDDRIQPEPPDARRITNQPPRALEDPASSDEAADPPKRARLARPARDKPAEQARTAPANLIGQRIERRFGFPFVALLWLAGAVALVVNAVLSHNMHLIVFAVLPATIGLALLLVRERRFAALLTQEGLEIETPIRLSLPYAAMEGMVTPKPKRKRSPIQIVHAGGVVHIPSRLTVRSNELFAFLLDQAPPAAARPLPPGLERFRAAQTAIFSPDRVFAYRARPRWVLAWQRRPVAVGVAGLLTALLWIVVGIVAGKPDGPPWIILGVLEAFVCGLLAVVMFLVAASADARGTALKNWRECALVVSPIGLALIQGDLKGELHWADLRDIRMGSRTFSFEFTAWSSSLRGINLIVAGATITIINAYDRPLKEIYTQLRAYWKGDAGA